LNLDVSRPRLNECLEIVPPTTLKSSILQTIIWHLWVMTLCFFALIFPEFWNFVEDGTLKFKCLSSPSTYIS
jgi:hypothetical protein